MKKLVLSSLSALALFSSASAVDYYKSYQERNEKISLTSSLGIGYSYMNSNGKGAKIANNAFVLRAVPTINFYQRLQIALDAQLHFGKSSISGSNLESIDKGGSSELVSLKPKIGVNVSNKENPLYVNVYLDAFVYQALDAKLFKKASDRLNKVGAILGIELEGFKNTDGGAILYGANFGSLSSTYTINGKKYDTSEAPKLTSYEVGAYVGLAKDITEKTAVYIRLSGKYQHFDEAKKDNIVGYPKSNNVIGMVEVGLSGL